MARASLRLIGALRETAARLSRETTVYRWSAFAHCNCGHLVQTITGLPPNAVDDAARGQGRDWGDQARTHARPANLTARPDYGDRPALDEGAWEPEGVERCAVSARAVSDIISELCDWGLDPEDVDALERLNDPGVRRRLGASTVDFPHHDRSNVIAYLRAWADLLEERLSPEERAAARDEPDEIRASWPIAAE